MSDSAINPAGTEATVFGPIVELKRLDSLDVLRGFAILGILFVNVQFFAMPVMHATIPPTLSEPLLDRLAWGFVKVFCELKFVSTFSVLFGAGMIMQMMRAERFGIGFAAQYFRRLVVLAAFGFIHAFAFWYGDILLLYSVAGAGLYLFRKLDGRALLRAGAGLLVIAIILQSSFAGWRAVGGQPGAQQHTQEEQAVGQGSADPATYAFEPESAHRALDLMREAKGNPSSDAWTRGEIIAYHDGPLIDALAYRAATYIFVAMYAIFSFGWHILGMFLLGAGLMKIGFFNSEQRTLQGRVGVAGLVLGIPFEVVHALLYYGNQGQVSFLDAALTAMHEIGAVALCFGYVGMLSWIASSGRGRAIHHPMRSVGRMALTTYLGSTLIVTFLMYWWGMGWFGAVGRFDQVLIVMCVYTGLLIASTAWLRMCSIGPLEWLWRSLTYLNIQHVFRAPRTATER